MVAGVELYTARVFH